MSFTYCIRMSLTCAVLFIAMAVFSGVAAADECAANVEHITFNNLLGLQLSLFEGILECNNLVINDRTFAFPDFTIRQMEGGFVDDALVFFNANDGPNGAPAANICVFSFDPANGRSTCDALGHITDQDSEMLSSGVLVDSRTGQAFIVNLYSDGDPGAPRGPLYTEP